MNIADIAFYELYPEKKNTREMRLKYSSAFRSFNANVKYTKDWMEFKLSNDWKTVSDEMKIGLIQSLLVKVTKDKRRTINMDLYDNFIKGVGEDRPATKQDSILRESFNRNNEKYFSNYLEQTNLVWGTESFTRLGFFTYADNTITISTALKENQDLLDYVMYHEMLHKKHKYKTSKGSRSHHHTTAFKEDEKKFDLPYAEEKLTQYLRKRKWQFTRSTIKNKKEESKEEKRKTLLDWFFG